MQNQPKSQPVPPKTSQTEDERTQKARMLISLLGADFTRSATHPFFRRLSQTAIGKATETQNAEPTDVSGALADLLTALKSTDNTQSKRPAQRAPTQTVAIKKPPERPKIPQKPTALREPLEGQHPAIIARELQSMQQAQKTAFIKGLSGRLARQVTLYSKELQDKA